MSQTVFDRDGEAVENPLGLSPEDLKTVSEWSRIEAHCPYCLYMGKLDEFMVFTQGSKKYPNKLSRKTMECPDCHQRMRLKTLMEKTNMNVEDFAYWFWEGMFLYKMGERVSMNKFFARVKKWCYDDKRVFWAVYREFKTAGKPEDVVENRKAWEDYQKQYQTDEDKKLGLKEGDIVTVTYICNNCGNQFTQKDEYPPRTRGVQCPGCKMFYTAIKEVKE